MTSKVFGTYRPDASHPFSTRVAGTLETSKGNSSDMSHRHPTGSLEKGLDTKFANNCARETVSTNLDTENSPRETVSHHSMQADVRHFQKTGSVCSPKKGASNGETQDTLAASNGTLLVIIPLGLKGTPKELMVFAPYWKRKAAEAAEKDLATASAIAPT